MVSLLWKCVIVIGVLSNQLVTSLFESNSQLNDLPRARVKRIIGGDAYDDGEWAWLVHLWGKVPSKLFWGIPLSYTNFYCGGVVINKRWIMTAAHCFSETTISSRRMLSPKYWHVKAGEIYARQNWWERLVGWFGRSVDKDSWAIWNLHAIKIVIHPNYDKNDFWANDIALVKVEKDFPLDTDSSNPNIAPVTVSTLGEAENWPPEGLSCVMKGWGCTSSGGPQSSRSYAVKLPIVDTASCGRLYNTDLGTKRLCAGYNLEGKGICRGDSGGPLVCQRQEGGKYFQEGIASFTSASDSGNYPGVFTRVAEYADWIIATTRDN